MDLADYFDEIARKTKHVQFNRSVIKELKIKPLPRKLDAGRDYEANGIYLISSGMVVGILAHVGEASGREWPVKITAVRTRSGVGWLEAAFTPGLYYPLKTAGYLEFAYVPGLRSVCMIRVGHRTFIIRSPMPVY